MGQYWPLFVVYFRPFLITISIIRIEAYDGVLWIQTHGRRMVGAYDTTEQWRPTIRSNDYLKYTIKV